MCSCLFDHDVPVSRYDLATDEKKERSHRLHSESALPNLSDCSSTRAWT